MNGHGSFGQDIFVIKLACLCTVSIDGLDGAVGKHRGDICWNYIFDGGVGGADDITALNHIPDGDVVSQEQGFFLLNGFWNGAVSQGSQYLPETVLRMAVIKLLFPGLYRWEGAEDQNCGMGVENRWELVGVGFVRGHEDGSFLGGRSLNRRAASPGLRLAG